MSSLRICPRTLYKETFTNWSKFELQRIKHVQQYHNATRVLHWQF